MFKIAASETYTAPVTVELPGVKNKQVFDAEFKRLTLGEISKLLAHAANSKIDDTDFCHEVMAGWKGVSDENGELPFSPVNLGTLLNIFPVAACIVNAYTASLSGARLKN